MHSRAHRLPTARKQSLTLQSTALTASATMHPILAVSRPCVNAGLASNKRDVSACSSRHVQPIGAVASAPAALVSLPYSMNTLLCCDCCMDLCQMIIAYMLSIQSSVGHRCTTRCPALDNRFRTACFICAPLSSLQTVSRPQRVQSVSWKQQRIAQVPSLQRAPRQQHVVQQQQCQRADALPAWAERFRRQVRALPQGQAALYNLLHAVEHLLQKAQHCGEHSGVMRAYLALGLIDVTSRAWQQRSAQLADMKNKVRLL